MHVADRCEWKKLFRGTTSLHRHLARRSSLSSSPDEYHHSASSSARARLAQLAQTNCLGRRAATLPEAPRPRLSILPSGASRSNGLCLGLSPSSVRVLCRLARFCLVSGVIHRQGQKPRASARPFCCHLYSDCMQGSISSITNHWVMGRSSGHSRAGLAA